MLLSIAAKRLASKNVLVKDLHAVETLGSITLLASDKTGTLTQNKMTLVGVWINKTCYNVTLAGENQRSPLLDSSVPNISLFTQACGLCTKSKFDESEGHMAPKDRKILGDATEIGLLRFALETLNVPEEMERYSKVFEIPFSSSTKWHMTINAIPHDYGDLVVFVKGAPERVMALCSEILINEEVVPLNESLQIEFNRAYEQFAQKGRRVLGFARLLLPRESFPKDFSFKRDPPNFPTNQFCFIALAALMDPPKHGVRKAIAACRTAGIQVTMVTGDHPLTAESIARQIGLIQGETIFEVARRLRKPVQMVGEDEFEAVVVHGDQLDHLSDAEWDSILSKREIVFARTSPKHKLEIVTRFQNKGHIVGVSGDGVNDSPALKKADLGISMNITGSDVSKEAASMILLDDNFPSIINGIAEGRLIFANLKKSIRYTLTHIMPEVLAFLVFIITAIPLPISSLLVLLIDLGSELGPALSYAYEPAENDLMLVPPRKVLVVDPVKQIKSSQPSRFKGWFKKKFDRKPKAVIIDLEHGLTSNVATTTIETVAVDVKPFKESTVKLWIIDCWTKFSAPFRRKDTGEVLVDDDLLIWCYLEGGIIETIGCFGAYLTTLAILNVDFSTMWHSALTYYKTDSPPLLLADGTFVSS